MSALTDGETVTPDRPDFEEQGPNPILLLHRALRGRYVYAILLGLLLAVPGAIVGYIAVPPKYASQAVIEASPTLPALLYENELNESMPAFDAFVNQQASSLQGERVLSNALDNDNLRKSGWPGGGEGLIRLKDSLSVAIPKKTNQIILSVTDTNPTMARLAAEAVIQSYDAITKEDETKKFGQRQQELERLRDKYFQERNDKRDTALRRALGVANTEDLQAAQRSKLEELAQIEDEIYRLEEQRRVLRGETVIATPADPEDKQLLTLQQEKRDLQRRMTEMLQTVTKQHRQYRRAESEMRVIDSLIDSREQELAALHTPEAATDDTRVPGDIASIEQRMEELGKRRDDVQAKLKSIANARLDVLALQQEADEMNGRFEDAQRRLESLKVEKESQIVGRVRVAQQPAQPLRPATDKRRQLAALGFMGGAGAGVSLVALFGIVFARVRVADDVFSTTRDFAMLGMIPEFPASSDSAPSADLVDSFHLLRVIIDARSDPGCLVAGVTSPVSGDGKSTVSLLLARSFAMTRRRVLLIDADLVGRGLTRMQDIAPREGSDDPAPSLRQLVVPIENGRIDFLPASDSETASDSFCRHVLQKLLKAARQEYDVVLLDTGPILGSIEAAAMVPVVDQMLLIVSRGLEARMLKMSTARLRELHARRVGVVFNRATTVDFHRSYSPVSGTSRRTTSRANGTSLPPMLREENAGTPREGAA